MSTKFENIKIAVMPVSNGISSNYRENINYTLTNIKNNVEHSINNVINPMREEQLNAMNIVNSKVVSTGSSSLNTDISSRVKQLSQTFVSSTMSSSDMESLDINTFWFKIIE